MIYKPIIYKVLKNLSKSNRAVVFGGRSLSYIVKHKDRW